MLAPAVHTGAMFLSSRRRVFQSTGACLVHRIRPDPTGYGSEVCWLIRPEPYEPELVYRENLSFRSSYRLCGNWPFSLYFCLSCSARCAGQAT
jgi:hypothetical protein